MITGTICNFNDHITSMTFYLLSDALLPMALRLSPCSDIDVDSAIRFHCDRATVFRFSPVSGTERYDFLGTGHAGLFLISETLQDLLRLNRVTGWDVYPTEIQNDSGDPIFDYGMLAITGRCGEADDARCDIELTESRSGSTQKKLFLVGSFVDESTWDGADIFVPTNTRHILVSDRTAKLLTAHKVTNIELRRLDHLRRMAPMSRIRKLRALRPG
jgi:hypothetical protein